MSYLAAVALAVENKDATDESIVARVIAGDVAAFELIVRRHNQRLFRATRAILKDDDAAEDAMQEAFVSAFSHLTAFGGRAKFGTWLLRIAVYEALGRLRNGKRVTMLDEEAEEELMATTRNPEEALSDREVRVYLERAVDSLPVVYRAVFVMRAVEGMSSGETAEALDIPEETVRTRFHRARGLLRDDLASKIDSVAPQAFEFHLSRCDRIAAAVLTRISSK